VPPTARPRTVAALWLDAQAEERTRPAYLVDRGDSWEPVSWAEAGARVERLANGLLDLGIAKGDAFGILAATKLEWVLFDYALALVGAVTVPVYATSRPEECAYVLDHVRALGVLVEDEEKPVRLEQVRDRIPSLRHVLTFADLEGLAARGVAFSEANPDALPAAIGAVDEEDLYTYIFTSGTTGPPKACMIRHRNFYEMTGAVAEVEGLIGPDDVGLHSLPFAHNFGRLLHLVGTRVGFTLALCPDIYRLRGALEEVRPTILPSVPRVFEKVHTATAASLDEQTGVRRGLARWALRVGRRASARRREGQGLPPLLALQHAIAARLVYSKFRERLGGRIRHAISGAAPLSPEVAEFFDALGILVLEGYGCSECTAAISVNRPHRYRFGTVGLPLPRFEVRTADDGELLVRSGTVFAGYYADEVATRAVLDDDGWLHTGDVAEIDPDGFISITDRKKDIIVTPTGKKVAPQNLENELKRARFVSQALIVGEGRPYLVALITLDPDETAGLEHADVTASIEASVGEINRHRSTFEQIKRFAILPRDFSAAEGEITPTMKLRRRVCEEHFAHDIAALYRERRKAKTGS
jgi:long-chain acyl-CoA synthetase